MNSMLSVVEKFYLFCLIRNLAELMTQNSRKQNSLLKKSPLIFLILITASCNFLHQARMEKMQGLWVIDEEMSKIEWCNEDNLGNTMFISKEYINLPCVHWKYPQLESSLPKDSLLKITIERNKRMSDDRHGTYYFPDSNADSVVFEAPNNPLVGRYKIKIFDDGQYRFMILSNDSTYLVCSQNTFYLW